MTKHLLAKTFDPNTLAAIEFLAGEDINAIKAMALFIRKFGKKELAAVLDRLHQQYHFEKIQEVLGEDLEQGLKILEQNR